jgi:hypothetical protein
MQFTKISSEVPGSSQNSGTFTLLSEDEGTQDSVRILKVVLCWNSFNILYFLNLSGILFQ